ncbi:hypothetical protein CALCODRAFT_431937 [Calocera cornea HHB12733]|uniref:CLASP N-terminal domain-containing protein n=1 Tax=Calocera cornea HHB12733 TaxID=1353952 RepID=A0A165H6Q4_9BASI|nr:hypothetical protein CALCODRAFT_431937 [Calocera cornea HHB12733]
MCSERTRLSGTACDLLATIAPRMGDKFDAVLPLFFPEVLKLCSRTNKLFIARAQKTLAVIITHTKLAGVFPFLREAVKDKSHTLRISAIEMTLQCMKEYEARILRAKVDDIESILRSTATDPNPEARKLSKQLFELYKKQFPDRVEECVHLR